MNKQKLVVLQPNAHRVYWGWYKYLQKNYELFVISPSPDKKVEFLADDHHLLLKKTKSWKTILSSGYFYDLDGLKNELERIKPDIILSKIYFMKYTDTAAKYCKKYEKKLLLIEEQQNFPKGLIKRNLFRLYFYLNYLKNKKYQYVAVTKGCLEFLKKHKFKTTFIPISFWKNNEKNTIKKCTHKIKLVYVGRFTRIKNVEVILKSIQYLLTNKLLSKNEIEFNIIGKGELLNKYKKMSKKLNITKNVKFHGFVKNELLFDLLQENDVFVLASNPEPIGLVVLEAMFSKLAILCSKKAGGVSYITEGKDGFSFNPKNFKELAEKILLFKEKKTREKMCNNSFKNVKKKFNTEVVGKQIDSIIKKTKKLK